MTPADQRGQDRHSALVQWERDGLLKVTPVITGDFEEDEHGNRHRVRRKKYHVGTLVFEEKMEGPFISEATFVQIALAINAGQGRNG